MSLRLSDVGFDVKDIKRSKTGEHILTANNGQRRGIEE